MRMNEPSDNDWKIASSLASSIGEKGGFPNAKLIFESSVMDEDASDEDRTLPRRFADHTYRDFSTYIKDGGKVLKHKKSESNFPARLHAMLSDEKYTHMISWMPHGRAFKVHDKKLLVEEALPRYTGQSKFSSFTRQLSGWGFKRLHQIGLDFGCYYNECFLRGHPRLTILMRRITPGQGKATPNAFEEPDFYAYAKLYPLHDTGDKPLFSPEELDESEDKKMSASPLTAVESVPQVDEYSKLSSPRDADNLDSTVSNQRNLGADDMAWTRVAAICQEDGLCVDPLCPSGHGGAQAYEDVASSKDASDIFPNAPGQGGVPIYEDVASSKGDVSDIFPDVDDLIPGDEDAPGVPYLQGLLHDLLMYNDDNPSTSLPEHCLLAPSEEVPSEMSRDLGLMHADYSLHQFTHL